MKFTTAIELKYNGLVQKQKKGYWRVMDEFTWYLDYDDKKEYIVVPRGFKTNFGSIPKLLRGFFDHMLVIFILHDFLYSKKGYIKLKSGIEVKPTRFEADIILKNGLQVEGYSKFKSYLAFIGVRCFGFLFYKK